MKQEPVARLVSRLEVALHGVGGDARHGRVVLAADGDGTLWTGDVGDALFEEALAQGWVTEAARPALLAEARAHGVAAEGDAATIARALDVAHREGRYPEDRAYAMMAWCMAGMREEALRAAAHELLLGAFGLHDRLIPEAIALLTWASTRRVPILVISASPRAIVGPAAELVRQRIGGGVVEVRSMTPTLLDGVIQPAIDGPIVYGEGKVAALAERREGRHVLAALGDSRFDLPMLALAEFAVAIRPKPTLLASAPERVVQAV